MFKGLRSLAAGAVYKIFGSIEASLKIGFLFAFGNALDEWEALLCDPCF